MSDYTIMPVQNAIVMLTNQCNCACPYCFESRDPQRMTLDVAKDVLTFIQNSHSKSPGFTFFGGEPMLEWDEIIVPLVEWSKTAFEIPTRFSMTTNGTLLTKEKVDFLIENHISFMLSIDGGPETQRHNRPLKGGGDSFDALMENIPYIIARRPLQSFRMTVTAETCGHLFDDIRFLIDLGCRNLGILPNVFEPWSESSLSIIEREILKYEAYILESFRSGERPLLFIDYLRAFYHIVLALKSEGRRVNKGCRKDTQCGLGVRGSVSIAVNGDIYGCHHISPLSHESPFYIGTIYNGLDESRVRALVDGYDPQRVGNDNCTRCSLDNICNGGCASNNYQLYGDVHRVPEMYCFWSRLIADSAHRIATMLGRENNSLFVKTFQDSVAAGG